MSQPTTQTSDSNTGSIFPWIALAAVIVMVFGGGIYWLTQPPVGPIVEPPPNEVKDLPPLPPADAPQPKAVVVGSSEFDFGHMEMDQKREHTFVIRNEGEGDLVLKKGKTTCKCTRSEVADNKVPPGGETRFTLEWKGTGENPRFRQVAEIHTNDRDHRTLELVIYGRVTRVLVAQPEQVVMTKIPNDKESTAKFVVFSPAYANFNITGYQFLDDGSADHFAATVAPAPLEVLESFEAKHGYEVTIVVKPGLRLGRFNQTILLETDIAEQPPMAVDVAGSISGAISIIGGAGDWNDEYGVLTLGKVAKREGTHRELRLYIRGEHQDVNIEKIDIEPAEALAVKLGERKKTGRVSYIPLEIDVIKNAPHINRLGENEGGLGSIVFHTDHPTIPEMRMLVKFSVID